jgi:hypothetical protein
MSTISSKPVPAADGWGRAGVHRGRVVPSWWSPSIIGCGRPESADDEWQRVARAGRVGWLLVYRHVFTPSALLGYVTGGSLLQYVISGGHPVTTDHVWSTAHLHLVHNTSFGKAHIDSLLICPYVVA